MGPIEHTCDVYNMSTSMVLRPRLGWMKFSIRLSIRSYKPGRRVNSDNTYRLCMSVLISDAIPWQIKLSRPSSPGKPKLIEQ